MHEHLWQKQFLTKHLTWFAIYQIMLDHSAGTMTNIFTLKITEHTLPDVDIKTKDMALYFSTNHLTLWCFVVLAEPVDIIHIFQLREATQTNMVK